MNIVESGVKHHKPNQTYSRVSVNYRSHDCYVWLNIL